MNYQEIARRIVSGIGGPDNIAGVTHCMTRLRFNLKDEKKPDDSAVTSVPGVLGVTRKAGQYQVVIGGHVAKVFKELPKPTADATLMKSSSGQNLFSQAIEIISACISPAIPALIAGGMIKVIIVLLTLGGMLTPDAINAKVLNFIADAPFYFLPVMLAYSSSQKFGVTPVFAVTIAGILLHPSFTEMVNTGTPISLFNLSITPAHYGASVIPILMMVWLMRYIESALDLVLPSMIKSIIKPPVFVIISAAIALIVVGPLGTFAGEGLSQSILWIQLQAGWLAMGLLTAIMPIIVMTGMHWAFAPLFLNASPTTPDTVILTSMLASNLAQAVACLVVVLKSRNRQLRQVAGAAGLSAAICGVTEPAMYGVTAKLKRPLYACMIAGGVAGIYMGLVNFKSYFFAVPSLVSLPQYIGGDDNENFMNALIIVSMTVILTFLLTWFMGFDEPTEETPDTVASDPTQSTNSNIKNKHGSSRTVQNSTNPIRIYSPISGELIELKDVQDEAFSSGMLGPGVAIIPQDGEVVSPLKGHVTTLLPSRHAIGITGESGIEILIHIGIDTVRLGGLHFTANVNEGDEVIAGQPLIRFDNEAIKALGFDLVTPVIVVNADEFMKVDFNRQSQIKANELLMSVV